MGPGLGRKLLVFFASSPFGICSGSYWFLYFLSLIPPYPPRSFPPPPGRKGELTALFGRVF